MLNRIKYSFRVKHRKGHSIHSPFVYRMVRTIFMPATNTQISVSISILKELLEYKLRDKVAFRVAQLYSYLSLKSYVINPENYCGEDMVMIMNNDVEMINNIGDAMRLEYDRTPRQMVLVIRKIHKSKELYRWWNMQPYLRLDLHWVGIIIIDDNLNGQKFKLKL